MRKNMVRWWVAWGVVLVVYHVVVFALPIPKGPVFVLSYLFTLAALGAQIYVFRTAFAKGAGVKSRFYGWPIARVGALYLAVQAGLGLLFMCLGRIVPIWAPLVLYVLLLGAAVIGFLSTDAIRDEIDRQDAKLRRDVSCMRALQSKAGALLGQARDPALLRELRSFSEALRCSDPVSGAATLEIEGELTACVNEIQKAVLDGDVAGGEALLKQAGALLSERNRLCKLNKAASS